MSNWKKIQRGVYRLDGSRYAVASMNALSADEDSTDFVERVEWAAIRYSDHDMEHDYQDTQAGENLSWFDTMHEAKAFIERKILSEGIKR